MVGERQGRPVGPHYRRSEPHYFTRIRRRSSIYLYSYVGCIDLIFEVYFVVGGEIRVTVDVPVENDRFYRKISDVGDGNWCGDFELFDAVCGVDHPAEEMLVGRPEIRIRVDGDEVEPNEVNGGAPVSPHNYGDLCRSDGGLVDIDVEASGSLEVQLVARED